MMKIREYNDVDPLSVLHLTVLALDFPLTPEYVARIRRTDPRPFPCLAVYAVEDEIVIGQVGVFRLPMISTEGREDVGGVWAVSTHPNHAGRGVATRLLEEAHTRMRAAGLRFGQARALSLLAALTLFVHNTYGFRHRELLPQVADILGSDYSTHQLSYDLRRLRLKGMIWRVPNPPHIATTTANPKEPWHSCVRVIPFVV